MAKAVKNFLFFSDLAGYYVRFWSRLFTYINAPLRHKGTNVRREIRRRFREFTQILFLPDLASLAKPFLEASFCERPGLIRRVIFQCPIWESGEKGVLLATKRFKMHKKNKKMTKNYFFWATFVKTGIQASM